MSTAEFSQTMNLNPVERFKRVQSSSVNESQSYTGFNSDSISHKAPTAKPSNKAINNNPNQIEQSKSALAPKQDHIPAQIKPLHYDDNKNGSNTINEDDNTLQPPSGIASVLSDNTHQNNNSILSKALRLGSNVAGSATPSIVPSSLNKNTHTEDQSWQSKVEDGAKHAISSAADSARLVVTTAAMLGMGSILQASSYLKGIVGVVGGSGENVDSIKDGIGSVANTALKGYAYPVDIASTLVNVAEVSTLEGPRAGINQIKKDFAGDIHILSDDTLDWVGTNKDKFIQAQEAFGLNDMGEENLNNETLTATGLAISEELNRRGNTINEFFDWAQDSYVSSTGRVAAAGFLSPHIGAGNINVPTAQNLATGLEDLPNTAHPDMLELKDMILGTKEKLAQYIVTEKGNIMVGSAIMYLIQKDIKKYHFFAAHKKNKGEFNADIIQNLVDIWREGPKRIDRMSENQQETSVNNKLYIPKSKHYGTIISDENVAKLIRILFQKHK